MQWHASLREMPGPGPHQVPGTALGTDTWVHKLTPGAYHLDELNLAGSSSFNWVLKKLQMEV